MASAVTPGQVTCPGANAHQSIYAMRNLLLAMLLDMRLRCVLRVLGSMNCVSTRQVSVMRCFFVMARFVMFRRFTVMPGSMRVMFR